MEERAGNNPAQRVLVARPSGREQVIAILRWAGAHGVAVTPMGGGSGVCGALSPRAGELVLDMSGFDRILEVDEVNLTCTCESGVNGLVLEKHLNERGLTLGHFPSSLPGTTLGGLIATRSSGQESSRYGGIEAMGVGLAAVRRRPRRGERREDPRRRGGRPWRGSLAPLAETPLRPLRGAPDVLSRAARVVPRHDRARCPLDGARRASHKGQVRNSGWWLGVMPLQSRL